MQRRLMYGLCAAIFLIVALIWVTAPADREVSEIEGQPLWPQAWTHIQEVHQVQLSSAETDILLARTQTGWVLPAKQNYPADQVQLRALFSAIAEGKYLQRKTAKPENHALLQVQGPEKEERKSVQITVSQKEPGHNFSLIIGKDGSVVAGQKTQYARQPDLDQVWLISQLPIAQTTIEDWMSEDFIKILNTDIAEIQFVAEGQTDFSLQRDTENRSDLHLPFVPTGWKAKESYDINQAAYLLELVDYIDVMPVSAKFEAYDVRGHTSFRTFSGLTATITWAEDAEGSLWAGFHLAERSDMTLSAEQQEKVKAQLSAYQPLLTQWRYKMPDRYRAQYLSGLSAYIEQETEQETE